MSQLYDSEDDIPAAGTDTEDESTDYSSPYLDWIKYSFIGYVLLGGVTGAAGFSALYLAFAPFLLAVTFMVLVAFDARHISKKGVSWGVTKYLYALGCFFPPVVLAYYFRRGMKTA